MRHNGFVGHDIGDADRVREEGEHRRVIGRVARIDDVAALAVCVYFETFLEHAPCHGELVMPAEPGVHMDGADLGHGPFGLEGLADLFRRCERQRRHVLAKVDRDIDLAIGLVGSDGSARKFLQDAGTQRLQFFIVGATLFRRLPIDAQHFARLVVIAEIEGAVLADDAVDRPHAGDVIAPAGGPAGDRDDDQARFMQVFHRFIGACRQPAMQCQRIVNVGEDRFHRLEVRTGEGGERRKHWRQSISLSGSSRPESAARSRKV
jgi:hypothetical protein